MKIFLMMFLAIGVDCAGAKEFSRCEHFPDTINNAYIGWPAEISCETIMFAYMKYLAMNGKYGQADNTTCSIMTANNNETLRSADVDMSSIYTSHVPKYITSDIDENSIINFRVIMKGDSACFYQHINLSVSQVEEEKCINNSEKQKAFPRRQHKMSRLICEDAMAPSKDSYNYTIEWYRNCTILNPDNGGFYRIESDSLLIPSADFNISGVYSCAINYNGKRRFVSHYAFCVKPPTVITDPVLSCPSRVPAVVGQDVKITCKVVVGPNSRIGRFTTTTLWKFLQMTSNRSLECRHPGVETFTGFQGNATCYLNASTEVHNEKCYMYVPTSAEKSPRNLIHDITLSLRNLRKEDFGTYHVTYESHGRRAEATVQMVAKSRDFETLDYVLIATGCLITVAIFVFIIVICFRKHLAQQK